jgi:transposase
MSKQHKSSYSLEFKQSSAKLAVESDQPIVQTARDLGINTTTMYSWVAKFYPNRSQQRVESELSAEEENKRLRKQLLRVTQERDILKKATAYFANEAK